MSPDDVKREIAAAFRMLADAVTFMDEMPALRDVADRLAPASEPEKVREIDWSKATLFHQVTAYANDHFRQAICLRDGSVMEVPGLTAAEAEASARAILAFMKVRQKWTGPRSYITPQQHRRHACEELNQHQDPMCSELILAMLGQEPTP